MYAILRAKKLKSLAQITNAAKHNLRLRSQSNIDCSKSKSNKILFNPFAIDPLSSTSFQENLSKFYTELGIKIKADNVLLYEFVATASPKFFENKSNQEIDKWANDQVAFIRHEFGAQLKFAILHLDEKTPHLHFFVSTELKSVKKYKNRYGENFQENWSLNSKRYDPEFLTQLQTRFALANKKWGLRRGVIGSKRRNVPLKDFYNLVDKVMNTSYKKQIDQLIDNIELSIGERMSINAIREKIRIQLSPYMNGLLKQQKALKEVLKIDFQKLQKDLLQDRAALKKSQEEVEEKQIVYKAAINGRFLDIQANEILMQQNLVLASEVERLKNKYEPQKEISRWLKP